MSRTVTALYDTRAEAEAARDRLVAEVDVESRAKIIDKSSSESSEFRDIGMSHDDRHAFGEGLNRGGFMLCAEVDDDEDSDKIISLLEQSASVDLDERQDTWRNEGWKPYEAPQATGLSDSAPYGGQTGQNEQNLVEEERIPIVEEQLQVGKREVDRGGARVRSYVRETPVHEQVNLREEHVSVERRPVSGSAVSGNLGEDAFQERNIEMTETQEVPMVSKEARVTEELVVKKTADERTEEIDDTVRRTEVDVDQGSGTGHRPAMDFGGSGNERTSESSRSFESTDRDRGN